MQTLPAAKHNIEESKDIYIPEDIYFLWNQIELAAKNPQRTYNTPARKWIPEFLYRIKKEAGIRNASFNNLDIEEVILQFEFLLRLVQKDVDQHGENLITRILVLEKDKHLYQYYVFRANLESIVESNLDKAEAALSYKQIEHTCLEKLAEYGCDLNSYHISCVLKSILALIESPFYKKEFKTPQSNSESVSTEYVQSVISRVNREFIQSDDFYAKWSEKKVKILEIFAKELNSPFQVKLAEKILISICEQQRTPKSVFKTLQGVSYMEGEDQEVSKKLFFNRQRTFSFSALPNHQDIRQSIETYIQTHLLDLFPEKPLFHEKTTHIQIEISDKIQAVFVERPEFKEQPIRLICDLDVFIHQLSTHDKVEETILAPLTIQLKWEMKNNPETDQEEEVLELLPDHQAPIFRQNESPLFSALSLST